MISFRAYKTTRKPALNTKTDKGAGKASDHSHDKFIGLLYSASNSRPTVRFHSVNGMNELRSKCNTATLLTA